MLSLHGKRGLEWKDLGDWDFKVMLRQRKLSIRLDILIISARYRNKCKSSDDYEGIGSLAPNDFYLNALLWKTKNLDSKLHK